MEEEIVDQIIPKSDSEKANSGEKEPSVVDKQKVGVENENKQEEPENKEENGHKEDVTVKESQMQDSGEGDKIINNDHIVEMGENETMKAFDKKDSSLEKEDEEEKQSQNENKKGGEEEEEENIENTNQKSHENSKEGGEGNVKEEEEEVNEEDQKEEDQKDEVKGGEEEEVKEEEEESKSSIINGSNDTTTGEDAMTMIENVGFNQRILNATKLKDEGTDEFKSGNYETGFFFDIYLLSCFSLLCDIYIHTFFSNLQI